MVVVTIRSECRAQEEGVCSPASTVSSSICYKVMGLDAMILVFLIFNFKLAFPTLFLHYHQEVF